MPLSALVVDDSMLARHTVCRFLEEHGFSVESVCNGQEALERLATLDPDLIITDLQMPHMDGRDLITALKANRHTAQIPIIVVAARPADADQGETRANYAIYKDIDIDCQLKKALLAVFGAPTL